MESSALTLVRSHASLAVKYRKQLARARPPRATERRIRRRKRLGVVREVDLAAAVIADPRRATIQIMMTMRMGRAATAAWTESRVRCAS